MTNHHEQAAALGGHPEHVSDHAKLFDKAWEQTSENFLIKGLKAGQDIEDLLLQMPGFKEAFSHELNTLECSDGRVRSGAKMGVAGEGILLNDEEWRVLVDALRGKDILITGHESCGAAAMAHPGPDSDAYGYATAKKLAIETGNRYREVHHEDFISPIHNERTLVVEGTGKFDVANWPEFPPQYISSAAALGLGDAYLKKAIAALTGIAMGDHGFSDKRFNAENPFYIIVSAKDEEQKEHLSALAEEAVKDLGVKVQVTGFVAPLENKQ